MYNSYSDYGYSYSNPADIATGLAVGAGLIIFMLILAAGAYVLSSWLLMKIFKKAGLEGWKAWVPFLNSWKFFELGGYSGGLSLLVLIPYLGSIIYFVMSCFVANEIGKKLQKADSFILYPLGIVTGGITTIIWYFQMALTPNQWNDSLGKESLAKDTILGYAPVEETPTQEAEVIKTAENHEGEIIQE